MALAWPREPVWDGHYYDFGARRIAEGLGYSDDVVIGGVTVWHPWCHYPVGYSGFLGFFYWLFGAGARTGPVVNALASALTVVLVHRLALGATTITRARIAGAITAVHPGLIVYTALLMTEPLAGFGMLLSAWLFWRDRDRPIRGGVLAGVVLGLSTLVRPPSLLLAPALFFLAKRGDEGDGAKDAGAKWAVLRRWARRLPGPGVALGMAVLTVLPWTLRNCRVMDGCAFVSTNAGWNLMIGAFPRATGRFETVRATDGCPVVTGQVQQDRCWGDTGVAHILEDPARWLSLAPKKLGYTFDHESFPVGYLGEANPKDWPEARKETARGALTVFHRGLLVLAALAAVPWPRLRGGPRQALSWVALLGVLALSLWGFFADTHPSWPLALAIFVLPALPFAAGRRDGLVGYLAFLVASVALVSIVFFGEDRYHIVASPALCLLAACALQRSQWAGKES